MSAAESYRESRGRKVRPRQDGPASRGSFAFRDGAGSARADSTSLQYINWATRAGVSKRKDSSANFFDDGCFQFHAIRSGHEHLIALEADWNGHTLTELAWRVTERRFRSVLTDVLHSVDFHHNRATAQLQMRDLVQNLFLGLGPVFQIAARNSAAANVELFGTTAD